MLFRHRHLPTFTRFTKMIVWKWMHLYWPMMIHYMTDKYEGRLHHLIVDTIYAVVSFILVATNIGLLFWFVLYFTPADVNISMTVDPTIKSGEVTTVYVQYTNGGRRIHDAWVHVTMPEGFLIGSGDSQVHRGIDLELGDLPPYTTGSFEISGVVYGNIRETYLLYADLGYTTLSHSEIVRDADRFFINDSAFSISVEAPRASTYDLPTDITVHYENTGRGTFDSGRIVLDLPDYFNVNASILNGVAQNRPTDTREFLLGRIEPHQQGTLVIYGNFSSRTGITGDQNLKTYITPFVSVYTPESNTVQEFQYASAEASIRVITPHTEIFVTGEDAEVYGESVEYTVTAKNTSTTAVQNIDLIGTLSGRPLIVSETTINGVQVRISDNHIFFPRISELAHGASHAFIVRVPTQYVADPYQTSTLIVSGEGFSTLIQQPFDMYAASASTRFASRISIASTALYWGPNGEQIGYGPFPSEAWSVTGYRVFLRVDNGNQPVQDVTLTTTLPGMTAWTGSYSTSIGTLTYDEPTRTVQWTIPSLPADAMNLGAQFEVRFLPNHLQIGLQPHIINDLFASAFDPFALLTVRAARGSVNANPILP
ncbi:MAG: hypothetical protein KIH62_000560 [Candidatus Kerfeldbacteria bacterium]|nr:hypothetical protein [Candidatus Kerfeldbacteria bacterium]